MQGRKRLEFKRGRKWRRASRFRAHFGNASSLPQPDEVATSARRVQSQPVRNGAAAERRSWRHDVAPRFCFNLLGVIALMQRQETKDEVEEAALGLRCWLGIGGGEVERRRLGFQGAAAAAAARESSGTPGL